MLDWKDHTILCLGGAGQVGREICRQLDAAGVGTIIVHDLVLERSEEAISDLVAAREGGVGARYVASAGDLYAPEDLGTWSFDPAPGPFARVCRPVEREDHATAGDRADLLKLLLDHRLGAFAPEIVRRSLIWNLVDAYRPEIVVDTINTATVLGYGADVIQSGRKMAGLAREILGALSSDDDRPLELEDVAARLGDLPAEKSGALNALLADLVGTSFRMTAFLDTAAMIRFVQCLHALFQGDDATRVPAFRRYVKVHTTGLGGMGFNIQYTHGDTGEPGLSTKLLGKVCATGSFTQLLLTLAHTPGCDVRVVVPATLIGFVQPQDSIITGKIPAWTGDQVTFHQGPVPLVDALDLVPCDGSTNLLDALRDDGDRVVDEGRPLQVPYLHSGENQPYAAEDIAAITALGQMGSITKEEVAQAALECAGGDSRYDILTAIDAAILLPTQTASVVRDRELQRCRARGRLEDGYRLPSVSLGNLGPATAKHLYEIEILRARYETVGRLVREANEMEMTLRACSYILEDAQGSLLRRQILSIGIPIFLRKGPHESGLLLGRRLLFPSSRDLAALGRPLDPDDPVVASWLATGWIDLTGPRMRWWKERFEEVYEALGRGPVVSRSWFDPDGPFTAGQFLGLLHSITGGQRKEYM